MSFGSLAPTAAPRQSATMVQFLWVCLGGAVGTGARYLLCRWAETAIATAFPVGTLLVNLLGSFLIAAVMALGLDATRAGATTQLALTSGVLGGFTTFSAFSLETLRLLQAGATGTAAAYAGASLAGCLGACALGWQAGRLLLP